MAVAVAELVDVEDLALVELARVAAARGLVDTFLSRSLYKHETLG
jgi:hypothetical protein